MKRFYVASSPVALLVFYLLAWSLLGCKPRKQNNAVPQCHLTRKGIGPIGSSMGENAGTKAKTCFPNHCCIGPKRPLSASGKELPLPEGTWKRNHREASEFP
jgi:hypothetical protein